MRATAGRRSEEAEWEKLFRYHHGSNGLLDGCDLVTGTDRHEPESDVLCVAKIRGEDTRKVVPAVALVQMRQGIIVKTRRRSAEIS